MTVTLKARIGKPVQTTIARKRLFNVTHCQAMVRWLSRYRCYAYVRKNRNPIEIDIFCAVRAEAVCSVMPVLAEELFLVQKKELSITCYMCGCTFVERPSIFTRGTPIFSSEMLHKDYYRKCSVEKNFGRGSQRFDSKTKYLAVNRLS
jgi:hypothetical protein